MKHEVLLAQYLNGDANVYVENSSVYVVGHTPAIIFQRYEEYCDSYQYPKTVVLKHFEDAFENIL